MSPHGPDTDTFESGTTKDSHKPERLPADSLAFMFEVTFTRATQHLRQTPFACKRVLMHVWCAT